MESRTPVDLCEILLLEKNVAQSYTLRHEMCELVTTYEFIEVVYELMEMVRQFREVPIKNYCANYYWIYAS